MRCANPSCVNDLPEGATARRRYCSGACRQAGARARQRPPGQTRVGGAGAAELEAAVRRLAGELSESAARVAEEAADSPPRAVALTGLPRKVHEVMRAAVAYERAAGTSWEEIGRRLELHPDTARRRYQPRTDGERQAAAAESWAPSMRARQLRMAADVSSRGLYLMERFPETTVRGRILFGDQGEGRDGFLRLLYDVVLAREPHLAPDPQAVAAAVAEVDLAAVDAAFAALDRGVRLFLAQEPYTVWQEQLRSHVPDLDEVKGPQWQAKRGMAAYYRRATAPYTGIDGYPTSRGWPYQGACQTLDAILATTTGAHAPGSPVQLRDGSTAYVLHLQWFGTGGGPDGYTIMPTGTGGDTEIRADQVTGAAGPEGTR
ncbi:hypothetical protein [Streptomyces chattanoogensis]|uniref:hypothetical protein n=1 Tax=Streptomyces chattanoogensis TaxID=66876 RepID=UPI0036A1D4D2